MNVIKELDGLDFGHYLALVKKIGGRENVDAVLRGDKEIVLKDVVRKLFDHTGRMIPSSIHLVGSVCDENKNFYIDQPKINYKEVYARFVDAFPSGTEFISETEFESMAEEKRMVIAGNEQISNLLKRAHFPLLIPKHTVGDYGKELNDFFLPAAYTLYAKQFPNRVFSNRAEEISGNVFVVEGTGYEEFISKMSKQSTMAWYFPNPLQGFPILAREEVMKNLSKYSFCLSGAISTTVALMGYMEYMLRDYNVPVYDCSAVSWKEPYFSLSFGTHVNRVNFGPRNNLKRPNGMNSSGLIFLG